MCQVSTATKKRCRSSDVTAVTKRAKQILLVDDVPTKMPRSPVDVSAAVEEDADLSASSSVEPEDDHGEFKRSVVVSDDLNLEVKLMQGAVNEMQATVNTAALRISELRDLLTQYAQSR